MTDLLFSAGEEASIMHDLRSWLRDVEGLGSLKRVEGADPHLEIGIITELNCRRKGPALLFDNIRGFPAGRRILTGTILDAPRLGLTLGKPGISSSEELVARLEGKMADRLQVDITRRYPILSRLLREERVGVRFRTGASALNCVPVRRRWRWLGSLGALSPKRKFLSLRLFFLTLCSPETIYGT